MSPNSEKNQHGWLMDNKKRKKTLSRMPTIRNPNVTTLEDDQVHPVKETMTKNAGDVNKKDPITLLVGM